MRLCLSLSLLCCELVRRTCCRMSSESGVGVADGAGISIGLGIRLSCRVRGGTISLLCRALLRSLKLWTRRLCLISRRRSLSIMSKRRFSSCQSRRRRHGLGLRSPRRPCLRLLLLLERNRHGNWPCLQLQQRWTARNDSSSVRAMRRRRRFQDRSGR